MRPLEQYATLRKGRAALRLQEEKEQVERARQLRILHRKLVHWLAMRLVMWGYKLEQYAASGEVPSL
jgi:hypothetical protein